MTILDGWENFNVIMGSSAGALIGLQFVLLTLLASRPLPQMGDASAAFGTPTVVHFSVVLLLSAVGSIPWTETMGLIVAWGLVSVLGMFYTVQITRHMIVQSTYHPVTSDWIFHSILPFVSYLLMAVAAEMSYLSIANANFTGAAAMLILLFTGVHNSWDAVTYHVFKSSEEIKNKPLESKGNAMIIINPNSQSSNPGPSEYFTGLVKVTPLVKGEEPSCLTCASVGFQPGARSAWHTHPRGQLLLVTEGSGLIQEWGKPIQKIQKGDVIWTPPNVKHWHGASPDSAMTHTAINEHQDGKVVEWMDKVTDEEYRGSV